MALRRGCIAAMLVAAAASHYTVEDYNKLPRLYHLDDYDGCLSRGGVYCLGTFRLSNDKNPHFNFIREYSADARNFDRTLLHRGYCVSSRCSGADSNTTRNFERCVQHVARRHGLRTTLHTLHYCKTREESPPEMNVSQMVFLAVLALLLFFNLVGTLYDLVTEGENKSKLLMAWSARSNWRRLVATHDDGDPRLSSLAPIQGIRVLLIGLVLMTHTSQIHQMLYLYKPSDYEEVLSHPMTMLIRNGTGVLQAFVVISNFLFSYSVLLFSKTRTLNMSLLPLCLLQRIVRILPVYLLIVAYAATWWPMATDGPQWPAVVGAESQICRDKFWAHALFLNNFYKADEHCLLQTWFIAVDLQLYVLASVLTLWLMPRRQLAVPLLALLFVLTTAVNVALAFTFDLKALLYIMVPENVRVTFRGVPSFSQNYISPWGSVPSCFLGLLVGHLHFAIQENGYKITKHKWLMWLYHMSVPLMVGWILSGNVFLEHAASPVAAVYSGLERPVFGLLSSIYLLCCVNNVDHWLRRIFGWRGFQAMGRLSLSVLMLHWCVNMAVSASRPALTAFSVLTISGDSLATSMWSHLIAIPLTVLVESPVQKTFTALVT
ncbi:nose resistant to fluoxetine protein 6-like [Epargyreus clarus]|uniref:nose resistant to fluoxetine protein 6-like n=1 Tax=Epargyreus clarus TaxID=520877 RepID=UPI003C302536